MSWADVSWAERAAATERQVLDAHLRPLAGLPGTRIGLVGTPPRRLERAHLRWMFWWQAHLLDCLVDAQLRAPSPQRQRLIDSLVRGIRLRNRGRWTNRYYDDIAWLGLALQRAGRGRAVAVILDALRRGWSEHGGGGLWWRRWDDYKNVPANAPAAILFARTGELGLAARIVDWVDESLADPATGVLADGLHVRRDGSVRSVERTAYTYCHGSYLGACVELAASDPGAGRWSDRAARTVAALSEHLADADGVLVDHGGGDGGLFAGITGRYLAQAALRSARLRPAATRLVLASAQAWSGSTNRELSVQLSRWMLAEAAALLETTARREPGHDRRGSG